MSYETEGQTLMEQCVCKRERIIQKYEKEDARHTGMDGRPSSKPLAEVSSWFQCELNKLRKKYGGNSMTEDIMEEYQNKFGKAPPIGFLPFPISELEERMNMALKEGKPIELEENKIY